MEYQTKKNKIPLGIYIHIPFCKSKCIYCDFYSVADKREQKVEPYVRALCAHIKEAGAQAPNYLVDTVYFGGGTPSYLGAEALAQILNAVRKSFHLAADAEITFEANPESVTTRLLWRLRSEGFNRVSLGVQSDDDAMLQLLGRPHTYAQAEKAIRRIRRSGFRNLSVDLMYGLPGQRLVDWERTVQSLLRHRPEHISCYGLKVEEGTPLAANIQNYDLPDDDLQADMYLSACEILRKHGYRQYEISNFCKKGLISRHNMKYWTGGEYLGFGPDASSDFGGCRFSMVRSISGYIYGIRDQGTVVREQQQIGIRERGGEYLMLRLRTTVGIDPREYEKKLLMSFQPLEQAMLRYRENGLAEKSRDGRWHLTPKGFLLSNTIISDLLLIQEEQEAVSRKF